LFPGETTVPRRKIRPEKNPEDSPTYQRPSEKPFSGIGREIAGECVHFHKAGKERTIPHARKTHKMGNEWDARHRRLATIYNLIRTG
jgi:hypothetical protein